MSMEQKIFHVHALSVLHVGTGQGVGVVDLPIARSRATNLPLIPGSAIKGVLRDELPLPGERERVTLFGPASTAAFEDTHAGALAVGDAQLLLLPVRSFNGVVAFATCPFILTRYARDLAGRAPEVPALSDVGVAVAGGSGLVRAHRVLLEDLDLNEAPAAGDQASAWAAHIARALYPEGVAEAESWRQAFVRHFAILPDGVFSFLADTATEVRARVRINDETRTVARGALWYEENLPAESVLWGVMGVSQSRNRNHAASAEELAALLPGGEQLVQIGGKHTVGRGLCRLLIG